MIPLDSFENWSPRLDACAREYLDAEEVEQYLNIPEEERQAQLKALLEEPIAWFSPVNEAWFRARWADTLKMLHPEKKLELLEVASGDADMIPQAMERSHPAGRYVAANMNKALTASLLQKTANLRLRVEVVEDDASSIGDHFGREAFDAVAFQHGVNDVIQAILCGREGVDTIYTDWMQTLPKMIAIVQREVAEGTLEAHAKAPFMALMESLAEVLKKGGWVVINHYMFQLDLDWGYPPELFAGFVPMVRNWFRELSGMEEVCFDGYERNWWLFLRKT